MHIYSARAHFAYSGRPLGEQFLCIFTVLALTLPTQVDLWESSFMHICGARAHLACSGRPLGEPLFPGQRSAQGSLLVGLPWGVRGSGSGESADF